MNVFELPKCLPQEEVFEPLLTGQDILIERIISTGQASPPDFWYDQDKDEWVVLLQGQAKIGWEDGRSKELSAGESVFIPAHERHRVEWTSKEVPCIWLAVHGKLKPASKMATFL